MIRNNLSWINLNAGSSGGGGGVSDYNDLANRPIISMTGTSQNPLKLWNLSTGLYLLNGYVYYNTTNTRECVNLFVSITAQIQNGKYVLSAFVPSWEGHYEYIKANSTSTDYTDTQILKMLTEDDVLTLTNEVEYTPTTDYHPSTKKYVDEAMQSVMEEFAKMGVNEQDIKTLIAENRRRDIAIQALLNETADKNVTIEEDTHTISLDYSMEDGMATVNSIEGSTLVNVSKTVDEVYVTKSQDRVEQSKVANTIGEQNGKLCPIIEGDTLVNVCDQKDPIAITKSYTIENSGNHIALQGEYDGSCRPVIQGNTMVNLLNANISIISGDKHMFINTNNDSIPHAPLKNYTIYNPYSELNLYVTIGNLSDLTFKRHITFTEGVIYNTFYVDEGEYIRYVQSEAELTEENVTKFKRTMIFEGDLTQTPELIPTEYVEGLKSSFEDNLVTQAMVDSGKESAENLGKYKAEYKVTGKNKCYKYEIVSDSKNLYIYHKGLKLGQHKISIETPTPFNINTIYAKDKNILGYISSDGQGNARATINITEENIDAVNSDYGYIWIYRGSGDISDVASIQLEEGSTPTEYEPYKEYTKTFYLNSPLLEGDTIEDINGVATHVHRYEKVVLDGSENWTLHSINEYGIANFNSKTPHGNNGKGFSDRFYITRDIIANAKSEGILFAASGSNSLYIRKYSSNISTVEQFKQWLQANPTTVIYELASPIYEPISTESILCDSYVNGHLDFNSAVPIEKVQFMPRFVSRLKYLLPNTTYKIQFKSDNIGYLDHIYMDDLLVSNIEVKKGINTIVGTTGNTIQYLALDLHGIGFNASNIVVTEATDADFDYFNGIQSTFEENLVTDENNPHYGKYRVIYRTKSSDGNASTVKSVYLNSPLLQGDKLVVVNGKLCHYHKMGMVVLDGSENWTYTGTADYYGYQWIATNLLNCTNSKSSIVDNLPAVKGTYGGDVYGLVIGSHNSAPLIRVGVSQTAVSSFKQWLSENPTTVVYELAKPYYEEISSNPKDTVVDFYANGTLEVQSAVYPLSMEFTSFEEELTYLYASTVYTVQFEANGNAIANITLGGATVTNQEITHGLNRIQVTTPSTLVDNKLIIDGCGDCKISKVVVTNSTEEFEYFEGMKSAFEDKQNEDGTYTVEIVVYNAPIRLNKDKE